MTITWHGEGMVKIVGKTYETVTMLFDPYSEKITGIRPPRPTVDVVMISNDRPESGNLDTVQGKPVIIKSPGEYDVKGVTIRAIPSYHDNVQGKNLGENIIYMVELEHIKICHLGCLGHGLTERQISDIGDCDILLVPVGGTRTLDAKKAADVVNEIEPRLVIPTHFKLPKLKYKLDPVEPFLKEMGSSKITPEPRLKVKHHDLPKEETRVVLLTKE